MKFIIEPMSEDTRKREIRSLIMAQESFSEMFRQLDMEKYIKEMEEDIALINFSFFMIEREKEQRGFLGYYLERLNDSSE
jgi:hypothetical protein